MSPTAAAIRHVAFEGLGLIEPVLRRAGYTPRVYDAGVDDLQAIAPVETALLIVLGGPIGADEDELYPFLVEEQRLLEARLAAGRPTLGICLGAQMIARALGARVYPGPAKEIGWAPVSLTEAGRAGPLAHLDDAAVLHWHGDTFDLPVDAALRLNRDLLQPGLRSDATCSACSFTARPTGPRLNAGWSATPASSRRLASIPAPSAPTPNGTDLRSPALE